MNTQIYATLLVLCLVSPGMAQAKDVPAQCVGAVDGDSFRVLVQGLLVDVRVLGVDAPESSQEWGESARMFAQRWCEGAGEIILELDVEQRDRYRRTLAWVWSDQGMYNVALVRAGLAVAYPYAPNLAHAAEIEAAQNQAKGEGAGFWAAGGLKMSPKEWRRAHSPR